MVRVLSSRCFPGNARGEELTCQRRRHMGCEFEPWVGKIPWRRAWQPTPMFLPGESHGQRSLEGYSPRVRKSWTRLKRLSRHAFLRVLPITAHSSMHHNGLFSALPSPLPQTLCSWRGGSYVFVPLDSQCLADRRVSVNICFLIQGFTNHKA